MERTNGKGVDRVVIAGGTVDTFAEAVTVLKPGGVIGNVNYLGSGEFVKIPRVEWGVGMGHKTIRGGLMPVEDYVWRNWQSSLLQDALISNTSLPTVSTVSSTWKRPSC